MLIKPLKKLNNQRGDSLIILTVVISLTALFVGYSLHQQTLAATKAQLRDFNSEASFYAGDLAATSGYLGNKNNPTLKEGTTILKIPDQIFSQTGKPKRRGRRREERERRGYGGGNAETQHASASVGIEYLLEKYTGDNLTFSYKVDPSIKAKSYCGKLAVNEKQQTTPTCLVDVCNVDPTNTETKTFGGDPFILLGQINTRITEKKLPFPLYPGNAPLVRSVAASGGGFRWTSDGNILQGSLNKVCNIFGYREAISSSCLDRERSGRYPVGKCNFHSPGDNQLAMVSSTTGNPQIQPADPKYGNTWVSTLTCQGKLDCP